MSTNRSWMWRRFDEKGYMTIEFEEGVKEFLDFAYSHEEIVDCGNIRCPCSKCRNMRFQSRDIVHFHLKRYGFQQGYTRWDVHGESQRNDNFEGSSRSRNEENIGMRTMVIDAAGPDFDWDFDREEHRENGEQPPNTDAEKFFNLLKDAEEPLWEGCKSHTRLSAVTQLLNIKSEFNLPQACYDRIVTTIKGMMPKDEKLPGSLYSAKKMVAKLGLGYEKINVCVNNCMLYYKEDKDKIKCDVCAHERYKPKTINAKKAVPYKVLRYLPLTPRLQRLYMSSTTAKEMTWHSTNQYQNGSMAHPAHSEAWKHFDITHPTFSSEPRNIRLGLCTDGFSPFSNTSSPYSCWPVMIVVYNLPPGMCMEEPYIFLNMVIPGPKSPGKKLDVFLRPLIDELKELWNEGVPTYDAYRRQNFQMRAGLLWTIHDFPAYGMISCWSTHGFLSCPYCMEHTKSFRLQNGQKQSWFDCHRQFLPHNHTYRRQKDQFLKGTIERDPPPPLLSGEEIRRRVSQLPSNKFDKYGNLKDLPGFGKEHNWVRRSIFWELPYWSTNLIRHNLDMMHIEKNVFDNIFNTLLDVKGKSKDNGNARKDLEKYCNRPELHLFYDRNGNPWKPKASYTLSQEQVKEVCKWVKQLKVPDGYASNIARCVSENDSKFYGMKSHDCHVFMQRLIPIAFRDLLPKPVWEVISELSVFFRDLCSTTLYVDHVGTLEKNIVEIICKLEKIFPPSFFDVMEHLPIHLAYEAKVGGPVQYRWMYPFERFLRHLKQKVKNQARVEGSIVEAYIIEEVSTFCMLYFELNVQRKSTRVPRNDDGGEIERSGRLSIFTHPGRPLGSQKNGRFFRDDEELKAAHRYILMNCAEVVPYIAQFDEEMLRQYPSLNDMDLGRLRDTKFPKWFKNYVMDARNKVEENIRYIAQGPSRWVKTYNGYFVNGFKFHTSEYGQHKSTVNSGVCVFGSSWNENELDYYGLLEEVLELEYFGTGNKIVLFKCHWYDISDRGLRAYQRFGLVEINHRRKLNTNDPFILAQQAQQVYYSSFPSMSRDRRDWRAVCKIKARSRVDIPSIEVQDETPHPIFQDPFQEETMPTPHEISITVDLDQSSILVDNNANLLEVPLHEIRRESISLGRHIGMGNEEEVVVEDDEEEEEVEDEEEEEEEEEEDSEDSAQNND